MNTFFTLGEYLRMVRMWQGGADTHEIAAHFECHEAFIYSQLPHYRGKYRNIQQIAERAA